MGNPLSFYGGMPVQGGQMPAVASGLQSTYPSGLGPGNNYRFGGLVTYEKPVVEFFPDFNVPVSTYKRLTSGAELPRNCVGVRFVNVVPGVVVSINGGGFRTLLNLDTISNAEIHSIEIQTDATGLVTVQAVGTGD